MFADTQNRKPTSLKVGVFANIASALFRRAVPVVTVNLNNQVELRDVEVAQELAANNILKLVADPQLVQYAHHSKFKGSGAGVLKCDIAYQGMLYCFFGVRSFPFADSLPPVGTPNCIVTPLQSNRFTLASPGYLKFGHKTVQSACVSKAAGTGYGLHTVAGSEPPFYARLQRFAKTSFGVLSKMAAAKFMPTGKGATFLSLVAVLIWRTTNRAVTNAIDGLAHTGIIPRMLLGSNCTRAFAPVVD